MAKVRVWGPILGVALSAAPAGASAQSSGAAEPASAPVWLGVAMLGGLLAGFGLLGWWLFFAPMAEPVPARPTSAAYRRERQRLVLLYLGGFALLMAAFQWDTSWHARTGLLIDDFFWPPHLAIYGVYALNAGIGAFGVARVLRLPGSLRARFRAEPLYGFIALVSAAQMASAPSDEVWHRVYGKDLAVWALPHLLILVGYLAPVFAAVALQCELLRQGGGQRARGLRGPEGALVVLLALGLWGATFYAVMDWENLAWWGTPLSGALVRERPPWYYLVAGLVAGAFMLGVAVQILRGVVAAATLVTLACNAMYLLCLGILALFGQLTPLLGTSLFYVPGALALDAWYRGGAAKPLSRGRTLAGGAIFAVVYLLVSVPATLAVTRAVELTPPDLIATVVLGVVLGALAHAVGAGVGTWLGDLPARLAGTAAGAAPPSGTPQAAASTSA
jgi:hypothetical protein